MEKSPVLRILYLHIFILTGVLSICGQGTGEQIFREQNEDITLEQGEEMVIPTSREIPQIFGRDETGYYALGMDHRYYLEHYDNDFHSTDDNYLILHRGLRERDLEAIFYFCDRIYLFTSELRFNREILYVQTIDKSNLRQLDDERKVMEIPHFKGWFAEFNFKLSRKEDRLLVYSQQDVYSKNIQDLHFQMYGKDLSLEWERDERIIYEKRAPRESIVKVNDKGDVFIMSLKDAQNILSLFGEMKNRYFLLALTDSGRTVNQYPVDFPNLYIRDMQIEPGRDHDLSCVGFYSPSHNRYAIEGIVYFEVNNRENRFENIRFNELEPYFLNEVMNLEGKKDLEQMYGFHMNHLILRDNGDMIMLAENQYDQTYNTYMNIMVASFSPGGNLNWKRNIVKRQNYDPKYGYNYCSYAVHAPWYENQVEIVYNDNLKNGAWPAEEKVRPFNYTNKVALKSVGIGPSGEMTSAILYRKTKRRMKTPVPLAWYDPLDDEMVIPSLRFRELSFYRISF